MELRGLEPPDLLGAMRGGIPARLSSHSALVSGAWSRLVSRFSAVDVGYGQDVAMPTLFLTGGTGFIGRSVVAEALGMRFDVRALARSDSSAAALQSAGAEPVRGSGEDPQWIDEARGADVLIDLAQPALPSRMTRRSMRRVAEQRAAIVAATLEALERLPAGERPLYFAVSGADDLEPDSSGVISHESPTSSGDAGFARIGVPVHRLVAASGLPATFVHFGVMVYGAGKGFADFYVDGLRKGRAPVIGKGDNRLPLTHVTDAARALVHLAGLPQDQVAGRTFLATDGSDMTQGELPRPNRRADGRQGAEAGPLRDRRPRRWTGRG